MKEQQQLKYRLAEGLEKLETLPLTQVAEGGSLAEELLPIAEKLSDQKAQALILQIHSQLLTQDFQLEKARDVAQRALKLFQALEDGRGHASCLNTLALILERENRIGESIGHYEEALKIAQSVDYMPAIGHIANNLGLSYSYYGDYERAVECYKQSLDAWSRAEIAPGKANVLLNLGTLYLGANEFEEAERYFSEALALYQQFDDNLRIITVRYNISQLRLDQGDLVGARECAQLTLEEAEAAQVQDPMRLGHAHEALGRILGSCGDTATGRMHLLKARSLYQSVQVFRGEANVLEALAAFPDVSDDEAIEMLQEAHEFFHEQQFKPRMLNVQIEISRRYKKLHAWEKALHYLENARLLEKEIAAEKSEARLMALRVSHELARAHQETEMERLRNTELAGALREVEEQRAIAREESRQKSEILSIAAHDMRNLTSNVVSTTAMSLEMWGDNQQLAHEWLNIAHNASVELNTLLEHMIDGAAIDSGRMRLRLERTDLSALVRKILSTWSGIAGTKQQTLQIEALVGVESLADPMRVQQIVHNLVSNAVKYSPVGGGIIVRVYEQDTGCGVIEVMDSGPGFSEEDRRNLFQPFQRLSARPTGDEVSSGLGLSIVKRLIDLHQAQIEVDDLEAGGSCFRVIFAAESENGS